MKLILSLVLASITSAAAFMPPHVGRKATVLSAKTSKNMGESIADAFFGTFEGNDYPDLGFATGFSGDPHKHTLDAWNYKLDFGTKKALSRQIQGAAPVRPRRGSAFPAAVPTEELLSDVIEDAAKSPVDAYMANEIKRAFAGTGQNDYPALETPSGYTGTANRNKGQRAE